MEIRPLSQGRVKAKFWLFGHLIEKEFAQEKEALLFFENLKANYITELYSIESCVHRYVFTISINKSKNSYIWEKYIFKLLMDFLGTQGLPAKEPISKVTLGHLEQFQQFLKEKKGLNAATVNRYFSTIKHFFKKLEQWEMNTKNIAKFIRKLSENPVPKKCWTEEDFQKVYNQLCKRDQLVALFLKLTGARLSSAARLTIRDINLHGRELVFASKKGAKAQLKRYRFPIYDNLLLLIYDILEYRKSQGIIHDYIFFETHERPLSSKNFVSRFRKALSRAKLLNNSDGVLSLHGLRTTLASTFHDGGMTANEIKGLLGHSTIMVTEQYLKSDYSKILTKINNIA